MTTVQVLLMKPHKICAGNTPEFASYVVTVPKGDNPP